MGSLMSGWDSPVLDPREVKFERNKSLTKEEIAAYWRSKKKAAAASDDEEEQRLKVVNLENVRAPSSPPALGNTKEGRHLEMEAQTSLEKLAIKNGWWTRSEFAFLNEPPVIATEGQAYKYVSQFHVAGIADSDSHSHAGIASL